MGRCHEVTKDGGQNARRGSARCGSARCGSARCGRARCGSARCESARCSTLENRERRRIHSLTNRPPTCTTTGRRQSSQSTESEVPCASFESFGTISLSLYLTFDLPEWQSGLFFVGYCGFFRLSLKSCPWMIADDARSSRTESRCARFTWR